MIRVLLGLLGRLLLLGRRAASVAMRTRQEQLMARHGGTVTLAGPGYITGLDNIRFGQNISIGHDFFIRGEGGLVIGDNAHISHRLTIYTHNHDYNGALLPYDQSYVFRPVTIGKNVWLGFGVTILPGTQIGDGAIVGAGAVVRGVIAPGAIVGAALGTAFASRDMAHYHRLDQAGAYAGPGGKAL